MGGVREEAGAAERVRPSQVRVAPRRRVIRDRDRLLRDPPPPPPARPLPSHALQSHRRQAADQTAPILQRRLAKGRCAYRRVPRIGAPRCDRDRAEMMRRPRVLARRIHHQGRHDLPRSYFPNRSPSTTRLVSTRCGDRRPPRRGSRLRTSDSSPRRAPAIDIAAHTPHQPDVSLADERGAGGPRRVFVRSILLPVPSLLPPRQVSPLPSGLASSSAHGFPRALDSTSRLHPAPSARQVGPVAAAASAPPPVGGARAEGSQRGGDGPKRARAAC